MSEIWELIGLRKAGNGRDTMYESTVISTEVPALPLGFPGVTVRVLHREQMPGGSIHGGQVVLTRMAPGAVIPEHWHSRTDETVFVISGDFIEAGVSYGPGTFFFGRAGRPHGPHTSLTGCTVLTHFSNSSDLDFNPLD